MTPRGILVFDVGSTNTKLVLFSPDMRPVTERRIPSAHFDGPAYRCLDIEPALRLLTGALAEFDAQRPVDVIVPCAHGSGLALLDGSGKLALPVMDYLSEPPAWVFEAYREKEPPFEEVFAPTNPMALTLGLQLMWQKAVHPDEFAQVRTIVPLGQYLTYRLTGRAVSEVTALGAQTHLWNPAQNAFSTLAVAEGWDRLFAPMARAYDTVGMLLPELRRGSLRGELAVKAGVHDSNANYLRYLAAGLPDFTLLSTGTWIIVFDTRTDLRTLDPKRDTATNTDVFGRPVACSRFMGGHEIAALDDGDAPGSGTIDDMRALVADSVYALPSFTDSGGPMPGTGGRGRVTGPAPDKGSRRSALAALYCALMVDQSLEAVGSGSAIVVDGPFSQNEAFLAALAALRPDQKVMCSDLRDGTAAGAALLALMAGEGTIPLRPISLREVAAPPIDGLCEYKARWFEKARANSA